MNFAFGGVSLVVAAELRTVPDKGPLDKILFALSLLSALNLLVRPVLIISLEGAYASYDGFYDSLYWTTACCRHAVVSLLIAFTLLAAAALDMMRDLRTETNTDPLSGLLNRRGFERAATDALSRQARQGSRRRWSSPTSIISKPSTTVSAMPSATRSSSPLPSCCARRPTATRIAGRLGGEEFVVLLTASDLPRRGCSPRACGCRSPTPRSATCPTA